MTGLAQTTNREARDTTSDAFGHLTCHARAALHASRPTRPFELAPAPDDVASDPNPFVALARFRNRLEFRIGLFDDCAFSCASARARAANRTSASFPRAAPNSNSTIAAFRARKERNARERQRYVVPFPGKKPRGSNRGLDDAIQAARLDKVATPHPSDTPNPTKWNTRHKSRPIRATRPLKTSRRPSGATHRTRSSRRPRTAFYWPSSRTRTTSKADSR